MPPPRTTVPGLDTAAFECVARLDEIRNAVIVANVHATSRAVTARDIDYVTRASTYIWVAAALEDFVKRFLRALVDEINAAAIPRNKLRSSLLALDNATAFQSLQALTHPRDLRKWDHQLAAMRGVRASLTPAAVSHASAATPGAS